MNRQAHEKRSLLSDYSGLAAQADGWEPATACFGSAKELPWVCERSHRGIASPNQRTQGTGCVYCSNRFAWPGDNDLATTRPKTGDAESVGVASLMDLGEKGYPS